MTAVATNYNMTQVPTDSSLEEFKCPEVDAILKSARDGTLWQEMSDLKSTQAMSNVKAEGGARGNMNAQGALGIVKAQGAFGNMNAQGGFAAGAGFFPVGAVPPGKQIQTVEVNGQTWIIVNPNDPAIKAIGTFAVQTVNEQAGIKMEFVSVLFGLKLQLLAFSVYGLLIVAREGQKTYVCGAVVAEAPLGIKKLLYWAKLEMPFNCPLNN